MQIQHTHTKKLHPLILSDPPRYIFYPARGRSSGIDCTPVPSPHHSAALGRDMLSTHRPRGSALPCLYADSRLLLLYITSSLSSCCFVVLIPSSKLQVFRDRMIATLSVRLRDLASSLSKPFEQDH